MNYYNKNSVTYGETNGHAFRLDCRPCIENLTGRFAQNGISVPRSGQQVVHPGSLITEANVREIKKCESVLPTLFIGLRRDRPIVQAF